MDSRSEVAETTSVQIIGQGGPTNDQFAALWNSLAAKYADNDKIIFGVYVTCSLVLWLHS